jgi:alcohol dehydrogenase class IV
MPSFRFVSHAQEVILGSGAITELAAIIQPFGWRRLMLCTSPSLTANGHTARVANALGDRLVATYDQVQAHVPDFQLAECLQIAEANPIDAVIGLGGGSPIGMAKAVALELEAKRRNIDVATAQNPMEQPLIPNIAIPTTYAGSEMTPIYGVTRQQPDGSTRKVTVSDHKVTPKITLYDPELTLDLPPHVTASTGINALAHCIEAIYSITRHPLATAAALQGIRYITSSLVGCFQQPDDLAARTDLLIGAHLGGKSLASVKLGVHHGTCHALGGTAGVPHGIANCIVLPHAIRYNADQLSDFIAQAGAAMGIDRDGKSDQTVAEETADHVYALIGQLDVPQRLREVAVPESLLPKLAENMLKSKAVQTNPKPVKTIDDALTILRAAW